MDRVYKKSRHIRWSWEESPDNENMVRYHFIIIDDKFRGGKLDKIKKNLKSKVSVNYSFEEIRRIEGKVVGTDFRYLFVTCDTFYEPALVSFEGVSRNVKVDSDLRERKKGSIEDYVANLYEK